jgi:predicted transposase YdaD
MPKHSELKSPAKENHNQFENAPDIPIKSRPQMRAAFEELRLKNRMHKIANTAHIKCHIPKLEETDNYKTWKKKQGLKRWELQKSQCKAVPAFTEYRMMVKLI